MGILEEVSTPGSAGARMHPHGFSLENLGLRSVWEWQRRWLPGHRAIPNRTPNHNERSSIAVSDNVILF